MTYSLSKPQKIGDLTIAVISDVKTAARKGTRASAFICSKRPVFVLARHGQKLTALDMHGAKVPPVEIAARCPAAWEAFSSLT
jgi:hypothetical protein